MSCCRNWCCSLEIRAEDFVLERQVVLEELAQSEDQPEEQAFQQLLALACGEHAYGRPILGIREQLLQQTPQQMLAFQQRHYCAQSCAVSLSGGFDLGHVQQLLEASPFAELPGSTGWNRSGRGYRFNRACIHWSFHGSSQPGC